MGRSVTSRPPYVTVATRHAGPPAAPTTGGVAEIRNRPGETPVIVNCPVALTAPLLPPLPATLAFRERPSNPTRAFVMSGGGSSVPSNVTRPDTLIPGCAVR